MNEKVDFLVIGTGVAGFSAALKLQKKGKVLMLSKNAVSECNTYRAAGGVACVWNPEDSFEKHIQDTLKAGNGLCDEVAARKIITSAPDRIKELISWGADFDKLPNGEYDLTKEGGHSEKRLFHYKDITGKLILDTLYKIAKKSKNIEIRENQICINLFAKDNTCYGVYVFDKNNKNIYSISAKATILATGGCGKVYLYTSNPDAASGDGIAMAHRIGAEIEDMEFIQFHPTCLFHPLAKNELITEALRGEGAILKDKQGNRFMEKYSQLKELAPRDVVSRAIDDVLKKSGDECVFLDISFKDPEMLRKRFPDINEKCLKYGIDFTRQPIPVVPAAHYSCGGVKAEINGKTNINQLFAVGECACTRFHGANRLGSNSLLEGLVCGAECGNSADGKIYGIPEWTEGSASDPTEAVVITQNWDEIRHVMKNYAGIVKKDSWLKRAEDRLKLIQGEVEKYYWDFRITPDLIELRDILTVAILIIKSAQSRKESRGIHYNLDHPNKIKILQHTILKKP